MPKLSFLTSRSRSLLFTGRLGTLGPLTSPSFSKLLKNLKKYFTILAEATQAGRRAILESSGIQKKLLSYGENIKKLGRISWQSNCLIFRDKLA
ncbi:hypothetical protein BD779DRAFT_1791519 [Infundibulicybe gibba]|nr:hypothetical protein BD779DRAFT_1791519 [Infundibulicybe gibba]